MGNLRNIGSGYIEDVVNKHTNPYTEVVSLRLSPEMVARLDRMAGEARITRAELIRDILEEGTCEIAAGMSDHLDANDGEKARFVHTLLYGHAPGEEGAA